MASKKEAGNREDNKLRRKIIDSDRGLQARQRLDLNIIEDILTESLAKDAQKLIDSAIDFLENGLKGLKIQLNL